ncbi:MULTISPECIES: DUF4235 domain-containing protein [Kitasatospora]|uniref:Uncharacterized protein DUF4235 n=1 Tax=Kitasatospora cineracea TaxID=88074 RepID=A0A3N4S0G0_9ACTN|nr:MULTISPECIES: DUF4235 domain-containing protein [Kitasatospora]ROR46313.1 uncharacterized protein DUF4235 [Kitasatospora cineracea]RPE36689.1 uncharacterized protein DUF4235 [Kitasatospora cineracea]
MKAAAVVYKPVGMVVGALGGVVAGAVFKQVWRRIAHEEDTPNATDEERGWRQVLTAAALQGALFALVKAAVDRSGATAWRRVTGVWPTG